jgi:hypothetical protein
MVFAAYTRSPRCAGLVSHRRRRDAKHHRQFDPSVGRSGPHDFAARSGRARLALPKRPSHPAPNVRDDRDTPLLIGRETRELKPVICPTAQVEITATDWHDGQIARSGQVRWWRGPRWLGGRLNRTPKAACVLCDTEAQTLDVVLYMVTGIKQPRLLQ